jgi:hypothetical protein
MEAAMDYAVVALGLVLGVAGHILKKIVQQRETDQTVHLKAYLTKHPYKTALMVFYAVGGVSGLYMTDTASFYTALLAGFTANSLSGKVD